MLLGVGIWRYGPRITVAAGAPAAGSRRSAASSTFDPVIVRPPCAREPCAPAVQPLRCVVPAVPRAAPPAAPARAHTWRVPRPGGRRVPGSPPAAPSRRRSAGSTQQRSRRRSAASQRRSSTSRSRAARASGAAGPTDDALVQRAQRLLRHPSSEQRVPACQHVLRPRLGHVGDRAPEVARRSRLAAEREPGAPALEAGRSPAGMPVETRSSPRFAARARPAASRIRPRRLATSSASAPRAPARSSAASAASHSCAVSCTRAWSRWPLGSSGRLATSASAASRVTARSGWPSAAARSASTVATQSTATGRRRDMAPVVYRAALPAVNGN